MRYIFFLLSIMVSEQIFCGETIREFNLSKLEEVDKIVGMLIIGGGPAGLTAAMSGGNFGIPTLVLTGYDIGGQINQTSTIENMPGFRKGPATDLVDTLYHQAKDFGAIVSDNRVESIDIDNGWPYKVMLDSGEIIWAMSLIIATGSEIKKSGVVGEDRYFGQGISPCAKCDGHFFKGQHVVVIGGGDTAIEEAMQLSTQGVKSITILVRSGQLKAARRMQDKISGFDKVKIDYNKGLVEIFGNDVGVTGVKVRDNVTEKVDVMKTDGVFLAIGRRPRNELVIGTKLKLDRFGYIHTDETCQSVSHPGIFAAGEVGNPNCFQAVEAASSGSIAANYASQFLRSIGITDNFVKSLKNRLYMG